MKQDKKIVVNLPLVGILVILAIISCIAIKSSAPLINKIANPESLWFKQLVFFGISTVLLFIVYSFNNERIYRVSWILYGILIVLLLGLTADHLLSSFLGRQHIIPLAKSVNGATRWYALPGFDFQPSEFIKIVILLCTSNTITKHNSQYPIHRFSSDCLMLGKVAAISLPPCILVYLQNDTGSVLIIMVSILAMIFVSGLQARWFIIGGALILGVLAIATYFFIYDHDTFVKFFGTGYKLNRFYGWIDPEGTYGKEGYQLFNALMAFGTAGMFGHGFQSSVIAFPEAQTDFIFAVIAQDFGFIGGLLTIIAIIALDIIILRIGIQAKNEKEKYFIAGLFGMLIIQQVWNIGMVMGVVPISGFTLPFISYGGSSLLSYMIAMGIVFDIDRQTKVEIATNHYV